MLYFSALIRIVFQILNPGFGYQNANANEKSCVRIV